MKASKIIYILFSIVALASILVFSASANTLSNDFYFVANSEDKNTAIYPQTVSDGTTYLFLPSSANLSELVLYSDKMFEYITVSADKSIKTSFGEVIDIPSLFNDTTELNGEYTVNLMLVPKTGSVTYKTLTIMKSANVRALFYVSDDPVTQGRTWVDSSKSNEAEGNMSLVGLDGTVEYTDEVTEMKGRGNSTFDNFEKKPYQIKIKNKTDLIGGNKNEANKKWVLLANAADNTFLHNFFSFALAQELNMPYTSNCEAIDFYYDGEYRGHYLLSEKVEVDETRVDIEDLDGLIEDANEGTDAYENPVVVTKTTASQGETNASVGSAGSYKYVQGLVEPELQEGTNHHAYLLEIEFTFRYPNEQSGFVTKKGQPVVTKNPEYLTKDTGAFISSFWQEFEDAVYSENGYNAKTGKYYYEYCDLESLVNLYLINELGKNYDSFRSSAFFYLPENSDIMYAGPVWDYDICYGNGHNNRVISSNPENFYSIQYYLVDGLIKIESFRDAVKETLDSETGEFYNAVMSLMENDGIIDQQASVVTEQQKLNFKIWDINSDYSTVVLPGNSKTHANAVEFFKSFVVERINWLADTTSSWNGEAYSVPTNSATCNVRFGYHINIVNVASKDATCTEKGHTAGSVCTGCETTFSVTEIAEKGHSWFEATCVAPKTCLACGVTDGEALEHNWFDATCAEPKTCLVCGTADGEALGHNWTAATCTAPKTCNICGTTDGDALEHDWDDATCTAFQTCNICGTVNSKPVEHNWSSATCTTPKTCEKCGNTDGEPIGHDWADATCKVPKTCNICDLTEGDILNHEYQIDPDDSRNSATCIVHKCIHCNKTILISVQPEPEYEKGDINKDGKINAADARLALRIAASLESFTDERLELGDMNVDKKLTAADARLILRRSAMLDT